MDILEVGGSFGGWMELAQDRDRWRALVSTVRNLRVPKMRGISWLAAEPVTFSRRTLLHGVSKWNEPQLWLQVMNYTGSFVHFMGVFTIYIQKLYMLRYYDSFFNAINHKANSLIGLNFALPLCCLLTFCRKESCLFWNTSLHTKYQDPTMSVASVVLTSQFRTASMLTLLAIKLESKKSVPRAVLAYCSSSV